MGYDLHITRKDDWADPEGPEISFDEWMAVVNADPELRAEGGYVDRRLPDGGTQRCALISWIVHSRYRKEGDAPAFDFWRGDISAKNPDPEFCGKMWRLAQLLQAKVQGDDGEYYDRFGNPTEDVP
jgi:hypothetical protein